MPVVTVIAFALGLKATSAITITPKSAIRESNNFIVSSPRIAVSRLADETRHEIMLLIPGHHNMLFLDLRGGIMHPLK
jgi:hypothetical protein